jgi:hypothetical protein
MGASESANPITPQYTCLHTLNDSRFGEYKLLASSMDSFPPASTVALLILKSYYFSSINEIENFLKECEKRREIKNVLRLLSIEKGGGGGSFCADVERINLVFEYIKETLGKFLKRVLF